MGSSSRTEVPDLKLPLPITVDWGIDHRDGHGVIDMQTQVAFQVLSLIQCYYLFGQFL